MSQVPQTSILILCDYYLPGYRGGGPIRTLANLVAALGDAYRFRILTRDRDLGNAAPYDAILKDRWYPVGNAEVRYLTPDQCRPWSLRRIIRDTPHAVLYINSCFSRSFGIAPMVMHRLGLLPGVPVILAPRGEFSAGALAIHPRRKKIFQSMAKVSGVWGSVTWQASSPLEAADIRQAVGTHRSIVVAPDVPASVTHSATSGDRSAKVPGRVSLLFLSRISPMKNLLGGLRMLAGLSGHIDFAIVGPIEDEAYWAQCRDVIAALPPNIHVRYLGELPHTEAQTQYRRHHVLFLPTLGENFGHAILEALVAGCPVLISDRTGWRQLVGESAGWDIPLAQPDQFRSALEACVAMDADTYARWSDGAARYGQRQVRESESVALSRALFDRLGAR